MRASSSTASSEGPSAPPDTPSGESAAGCWRRHYSGRGEAARRPSTSCGAGRDTSATRRGASCHRAIGSMQQLPRGWAMMRKHTFAHITLCRDTPSYLKLTYVTLYYLTLSNLILPQLKLPLLILPHLTSSHLTLLYFTIRIFHCLALPYLTLYYLILSHLIFPYLASRAYTLWPQLSSTSFFCVLPPALLQVQLFRLTFFDFFYNSLLVTVWRRRYFFRFLQVSMLVPSNSV